MVGRSHGQNPQAVVLNSRTVNIPKYAVAIIPQRLCDFLREKRGLRCSRVYAKRTGGERNKPQQARESHNQNRYANQNIYYNRALMSICFKEEHGCYWSWGLEIKGE